MTDAQITSEPDETFDLDEFVQGRGYPTDTVTVFTNADAAYAHAQIQERLTALAQDKEALDKRSAVYKEKQAEFADLEKQAADLKQKIVDSALTFSLRGIAPGHINKIIKDVNAEAAAEKWVGDEAERQATYRIMADHIISVTRADGKVDKRKFTPERAANLDFALPESEWDKIDHKIRDLSFRSTYFDTAVDAGFLPKS